jgi:hypothetical protein
MTMTDDKIKQLVGRNISGLDIIHGELKNLMYEVEQDMIDIDVDDPIYKYMEGMLDAYVKVYQLTYDISFSGGE